MQKPKSKKPYMKTRLESGLPFEINDDELEQWYVYTDAAYHQEDHTGGLGATGA